MRSEALLTSIGLWVPPLRLLSAFLWQVAEQRQFKYYTRLEEFVSVVLEIVPDLLCAEERDELLLGLRAKFILELCHDQPSVTLQIMKPHLDRVSMIAEPSGNRTIKAGRHFVNLIKTLLQNPTYRNHFFQEIYHLHYGAKYDTALQLLVWKFLSRLEMFIPVPSFHEAASWLDEDSSALEDALQVMYDTKKIENLLRYLKHSTNMYPASSPSAVLTNTIFSTLSVCFTAKVVLSRQMPDCLSAQYDPQNKMVRSKDISEEDRGDLDKEDDHNRQNDTFDLIKQESVDGYSSQHENSNSITCVKEVPTSREVSGQSVLRDGLLKMGSQSVNTADDAQCKTNLTRPEDKRNKRHTCLHCDKTFRFLCHLNNHTRVHTREQRYGCTVCGIRFTKPLHLQKHTQLHTGARRYSCSYCGKAFKHRSHLRDHIRLHTGERPYICSVCGKRFIQRSHMVVHGRKHTNKTPECRSDGKVSSSGNEARVSQLVNDAAEDCTHQLKQLACTEPDKDCQTPQHKCSECGKVFMYKRCLTKHQVCHISEKSHICSYCGKAFKLNKHLKDHTRKHTGEKPYACSVCGERFTYRAGLHYHMRLHSSEDPENRIKEKAVKLAGHKANISPQDSRSLEEETQLVNDAAEDCTHQLKQLACTEPGKDCQTPQHKCSECGKVFMYKRCLTKHQVCHISEKSHICSYCGKAFKLNKHLKDHTRKHTGEKPYACSVCGKRFTYRTTRLAHMRLHSNEDPENRIKEKAVKLAGHKANISPQDSRSFEGETQLVNDTAEDCTDQQKQLACTRRGIDCQTLQHKCSECGKVFIYKRCLTKHQLSHISEKSHICSYCGKAFKLNKHLKDHTRKHTGEKPYACSVCGERFTYRTTRLTHMRLHNSENPQNRIMEGESGNKTGFFPPEEVFLQEESQLTNTADESAHQSDNLQYTV